MPRCKQPGLEVEALGWELEISVHPGSLYLSSFREEPRGKEMVIPSSELLAAGIDHGHTPSFIQKSERQFEKFYPLPIESYR